MNNRTGSFVLLVGMAFMMALWGVAETVDFLPTHGTIEQMRVAVILICIFYLALLVVLDGS